MEAITIIIIVLVFTVVICCLCTTSLRYSTADRGGGTLNSSNCRFIQESHTMRKSNIRPAAPTLSRGTQRIHVLKEQIGHADRKSQVVTVKQQRIVHSQNPQELWGAAALHH